MSWSFSISGIWDIFFYPSLVPVLVPTYLDWPNSIKTGIKTITISLGWSNFSWGLLVPPQNLDGISSGHMTCIFNIGIMKREKNFSPEHHSKVVKFAKKWSSRCTDCSGKRWAIYIFPLKMIQRGDHWMIFFHSRAGFRESKFSKK